MTALSCPREHLTPQASISVQTTPFAGRPPTNGKDPRDPVAPSHGRWLAGSGDSLGACHREPQASAGSKQAFFVGPSRPWATNAGRPRTQRPRGSDIGTGEGSDGDRGGGGKGGAGPRASWRWTLGRNKMGDKTQSQVPTANLTMQFHSHSVAAAERRPTPGVKCNGLMEPGKITSAQGVSEPASPGSHRGGQAAAPAQRRREAREPTGPSNPSAVTGRAQYEEFTRYRFEHGGMGQAFLHLHFASHHPGACSAQSHPPLFE